MAFSVSTRFSAVDSFSSTLTRMERGVVSFSNKAVRSVKKVTTSINTMNNKINNSVRGLGEMSGLLGAVSAGMFIQTAADAALELDKNVSAAAAKFGIFTRESAEFDALEKKARKLGATTEFTAGQAAEGLKNLATAGFTAEQAMAGLDTTLALATATQSELGIASDVASKSMAAFGLKSNDPKVMAKNLEMTSDVLNKLITTSGFGQLDEFLDVIAMSGSGARAAGVDIQTWGAIVAGSVSEAVPASVAGTRFANMLSFMTKNAAKFNRVGIKLKDVKTGNYRDIIDILEDVNEQTKGMDKFDRAGLMFKLFGERGSKMAVSLLENGIPALRKYKQEIVDAGGTTKQMADLMRSGLSGMVASAGSAIQELGISIEKTFDKEIKAAIVNITEAARNTGNWVKENKTLLSIVFDAGKAIATMAIAVKAYVFAAKIATAVTTGYYFVLGVAATFSARAAVAAGTHMAALHGLTFATNVAKVAMIAFNFVAAINPLVWIAVAIASIVMLIVYWDKVKKKMEEFSGSAGFQLLKLAMPLLYLLDLIVHFQNRWDGITNAFKKGGIIAGIKAIGKAFLSFILTPIKVITEQLAKWTGSYFLKGAAASLEATISGLDKGLVAEGRTEQVTAQEAGDMPIPLVDNTVTAEQVRTSREEQIQKMLLDINIKGDTNNVQTETQGMPSGLINMPSTIGAF